MHALILQVGLRIILFVLFVIPIAALTAPAKGEKYKCEVVNDIARLGAHPRSRVAIESDDDDPNDGRYCSFSVNGWPASSPPRDQVMRGLEFLDSSTPGEIVRREPQTLAAVLMSAGSADRPSTELIDRLKNSGLRLAQCLDEFAFGSFPRFEDDAVRCIGYEAGQYELFEITTPKLEIAVFADGKLRRLYLPRRR